MKNLIEERLITSKDLFIFDGKCSLNSNIPDISVEIKISVFTDTNDLRKFIIILRDTTQRDILATLESNNKFKDNVIASVSHELRTPLNGFRALVESCIQDTTVSREVKETYIAPALRCATLLSFIVNDILDYSLLSAQKLKMNINKIDLFQLLQNCSELIKNHYSQQNYWI